MGGCGHRLWSQTTGAQIPALYLLPVVREQVPQSFLSFGCLCKMGVDWIPLAALKKTATNSTA